MGIKSLQFNWRFWFCILPVAVITAETCQEGFHVEGNSCQPNQCQCPGGQAQQYCHTHGTIECSSCGHNHVEIITPQDDGYLLKTCKFQLNCGAYEHISDNGQSCLPNICLCNGGNALRECRTNLLDACESCHYGFTMVPYAESEYFGCVKDRFVEQNLELTACEPGFHLSRDRRTCQRNQCKCHGGTLTPECTIHGAQSCSECRWGFGEVFNSETNLTSCDRAAFVLNCPAGTHKNQRGNHCKRNQCSCSNGKRMTRENCLEHQSESCYACDERNFWFLTPAADGSGRQVCRLNCPIGYRQEGNSCQRNICRCDGGQAAEICLNHGSQACASCDEGNYFSLVDATNSNGDSLSLCQLTCPEFYHEEGGRCQPNQCYCEYGFREINCPVHNANICRGCTVGYEINTDNFSCQPQIGSAVTATCQPGYHLEGNTCQKNQCYCEGGQAAQFCQEHEGNECEVCFGNYQKVEITEADTGVTKFICRFNLVCNQYQHVSANGWSCVPNVCTCRGGQASQNCLEHDLESCSSCHFGYEQVFYEDQPENFRCVFKIIRDNQLIADSN